MRRLLKVLHLKVLHKLDVWILIFNPTIWRTRVHYMLFYLILASGILFILGLFWPISAINLSIDPFEKIILSEDAYYIYLLPLAFGFILYWGYTQFIYRLKVFSFDSLLITLFVYFVVSFFLISVSINAVKIGKIVKTAHFLVDSEDIDLVKKNNYFAYGFYVPDSILLDSINPIKDTLTLIQNGERDFRRILSIEDAFFILKYQHYNQTWFEFIDKALLLDFWDRQNAFDLITKEDTSFRISEESYQLTYLFNLEKKDKLKSVNEIYSNFYRNRYYSNYGEIYPEKLEISAFLYFSNRSYQIFGQNSKFEFAKNYSSYFQAPFHRDYLYLLPASSRYVSPKFNQLGHIKDRLISLNKYYNQYYLQKSQNKTEEYLLKKYQIPTKLDTINYSEIQFILPRHVYQLERMVHSSLNAKEFLQKEITLFQSARIMVILLLISLFIFGCPFLFLKDVLWGVLNLFILFGGYLYFAFAADKNNPLIASEIMIYLSIIMGIFILFFIYFLLRRYKNKLVRLIFNFQWVFIWSQFIYFLLLEKETIIDLQSIILINLFLTVSAFLIYPYIHSLPDRN